ncbi:MAG: shikimate kinase [Bacteroidota bacterium]
MKVILIGYMGSGKSVIAKNLATDLQISVVDLDNLIEKKANSSIETIFSEKGELYFRKIEHELFLDYMQSNESFVMSTGGGTPCYYNHHELLKNEDCISIYLKASVATLYERLLHGKKKRPLLANLSQEELKEYIAKHLFDRNYYYHQAKHTIVVDDKSISAIVTEIKMLLT